MLNLKTHFTELKYRFLYIFFSFILTFFSSYFYIDYIIYFFSIPLIKIKIKSAWLNQADFIFTNVFEAFSAYYFVAFVISIYFTIPILTKIIFSFIKLGLQLHEKKAIIFILNLFIFCCICSIIFLYKILLPFILTFFITFENITKTNLFTLKLEQKLLDYIYLVVFFLLWCNVFFQIPLLLIFFLTNNIVNFYNLIDNRRLLLINFLIIGAIFSPPEIGSQLLIALPLGFIFEVIFFLYYVKKLYEFNKIKESFRMVRVSVKTKPIIWK